MEWIFLSPHLDDVIFSCGGLLWERVLSGDKIEIWTICAGDPLPGQLTPYAREMHNRWGTGREAVNTRREEDRLACENLGVQYRHFDIPDCIYRVDPISGEGLYTSDAMIFGLRDLREAEYWQAFGSQHFSVLPAASRVVCPLTIGNHVDHQWVRLVLENNREKLWYYADVPYALENITNISDHAPSGSRIRTFPVSISGLDAWVNAIGAYKSQIGTFWRGGADIRRAIENYSSQMGGLTLWSLP